MDLRKQRTQKNIIDAFMNLRAKKRLEKITVTELSQLAMINKATFYQHYKDIYDLSDQLEKKAIQEILASLPHPEYFITNPKQNAIELAQAVSSQSEQIDILFGDERKSVLIERLESEIKEGVKRKFPQYIDSVEKDMMLTVLIQGTFHAYYSYADQNEDYVMNVLGNISECLLNNYKVIN